MKRVCFYVVSIVFLLACSPSHSWAASQDDLARQCPQADKYRLQRSFYFSNLKEVVRAPVSAKEVEARFAELASTEKWRRQAAISSLALAGNIEIFQQLLAEGDGNGMATYGANYLREDGNLCIDPQIEKAVIRHFQDPRFSKAFLSFFHKNLYSSRRIFETLATRQFDAADPDQYGRLVKALCATRLAGLDDQMLEIGREALLHDTPAQKRVMPGVHQGIIGYLASQKNPAFAYYRTVLAVEPRSERVAYFQNSYAQTRLAIYQALVRYEDEGSFSIFLEQLNELSREPWGPFYVNDLNHLITNLKAHGYFEKNKDKVSPFLSQILSAPSLPWQTGYTPPRERAGEPAFYDQQIRKQVYALLVEIDSKRAAALLLDELAGLFLRPAGERRQILSAALLQGLSSLSENTPLDVERLVELAARLVEQTEILRVAEILGRHHHPAGFRFVTNRFEASFAGAEGIESVVGRSRLGDILFNILLQFSDPKYLVQTREKIDALFLAEKLAEERYGNMSITLAKLLGEESSTYIALLQAKKEEVKEKRRQELVAAQNKWQQEVVEEYARQSSDEGVAANIKALSQFNGEAKKAAYWLIRIGSPILPQAHKALADSDANTESKMQLMVVLGEIGDKSSAPFIIAAAKTEPGNTMLLKDAFLALGRIPQTPDAIAFAQECLEDGERSNRHKMSALAYFASHRDKQGLAWSRKFLGQDAEPPLRATALYLAAMLGEEGVKGQIVLMLEDNPERGIAHLLWRSLAEISSHEEYQETVAKLQADQTWETKQVDQYVQFRTSSGEKKVELAEKLLAAKTPFYAESAIRFLLEIKEFDVLARYFREQRPGAMSLEMVLYMSSVAQRIFSEARRQGYVIEEKESKIKILPAQ